MSQLEEFLTGEIVDNRAHYTLRELSELCGASPESLVEFVHHGVLDPEGREPEAWLFSAHMVIRTRKAHRLLRDLDLNLPGVALCLDLLDEVELLRRQVRALHHSGQKPRSWPSR
jgi:chaperone modulatory protein CbpM